MPLDYSNQRNIQANAQKAGLWVLVQVVRSGATFVTFLARFVIDMAKSIVGAR